MSKPKPADRCLARVHNKRRSDAIKFCGEPAEANDLCRRHNRRLDLNMKYRPMIESIK